MFAVAHAACLVDVTATWLLSVLPFFFFNIFYFLPQADQNYLVGTLTPHLHQSIPCVM